METVRALRLFSDHGIRSISEFDRLIVNGSQDNRYKKCTYCNYTFGSHSGPYSTVLYNCSKRTYLYIVIENETIARCCARRIIRKYDRFSTIVNRLLQIRLGALNKNSLLSHLPQELLDELQITVALCYRQITVAIYS